MSKPFKLLNRGRVRDRLWSSPTCNKSIQHPNLQPADVLYTLLYTVKGTLFLYLNVGTGHKSWADLYKKLPLKNTYLLICSYCKAICCSNLGVWQADENVVEGVVEGSFAVLSLDPQEVAVGEKMSAELRAILDSMTSSLHAMLSM